MTTTTTSTWPPAPPNITPTEPLIPDDQPTTGGLCRICNRADITHDHELTCDTCIDLVGTDRDPDTPDPEPDPEPPAAKSKKKPKKADPDPTPRQHLLLPIDQIRPNPNNRTATNIDDLEPSIRALGVLNPILVRPVADQADTYEIVAGERRWRAACTAGHQTIPAVIEHGLTEAGVEIRNLVENLQREDLDPIDEARGYQRLLDLGWTQRDIAEHVGCNQSNVSRKVALLDAPAAVLAALADGPDAGGITVHQAVELTKIDHDRAVSIVETFRGDPHELDGQLDIERAYLARRAELDKAGVAVLADGAKATPLARDSWGGGLRFTRKADAIKAHENEPCHAVRVHRNTWGIGVEEVCTDRKRHGPKGDSTLKEEKKPKPDSAAKTATAAQERRAAEEAEARAHRHDFMASLVRRKRLPDRDALIDRMLLSYIETLAYDVGDVAGGLLGLPEPKAMRWGHPDWEATLVAYAKKGRDEALHVCLAIELAENEERRYDADVQKAHRARLLDVGYQPHPSEEAAFGIKRTRVKKAAAKKKATKKTPTKKATKTAAKKSTRRRRR